MFAVWCFWLIWLTNLLLTVNLKLVEDSVRVQD